MSLLCSIFNDVVFIVFTFNGPCCSFPFTILTASIEFNLFHYSDSEKTHNHRFKEDDEKCRLYVRMCINRLYRSRARAYLPILFLLFESFFLFCNSMKKKKMIRLKLKSAMYQFWAIVTRHKSQKPQNENKRTPGIGTTQTGRLLCTEKKKNLNDCKNYTVILAWTSIFGIRFIYIRVFVCCACTYNFIGLSRQLSESLYMILPFFPLHLLLFHFLGQCSLFFFF